MEICSFLDCANTEYVNICNSRIKETTSRTLRAVFINRKIFNYITEVEF